MRRTGSEVSINESLRKKVSERVLESFVDLIPKEEWDQLVQKEIQLFLQHDFKKIVREECKNTVLGIVRKELQKPEWQSTYDTSGKQLASQIMVEIIKSNSDDILAGFLGNLCQNVKFTIQSEVQNMMNNY